jgi:hypothetical protein
LIAERIESPFGSGLKRSASSPPSPVFDLPPMRFMAIASVVCASREIEPKRHRAGGEALDDVLGRLDLVERHRLALLVAAVLIEQAAHGQQPLGLLVDDFRERLVASGSELPRTACCSLATDSASRHGPRRGRGRRIRRRRRARSCRPARRRTRRGGGARFLGDLGQADALDAGRGAGEILVDEIGLQADRVEDLRAAIGLVGRDAHLGHHLEQALADRLDVALDDLVGVERRRQQRSFIAMSVSNAR